MTGSMGARRVQLSRKKGWRKPDDTVVVARPSRWGNPFRVSPGFSAEWAVANYRAHLVMGEFSYSVGDVRAALAGKNLACWCKPEQPCHADVLLELANREDA